MSYSTDCEPNSTSTLPEQPGVLVIRKHHFLVRWSHWLNVPILLGLILSGISIWASPIYQHKPDPNTGNTDAAAGIGIWICAHVPGLHHYSSPPDWIYNHMSLGPGMLGLALRLHWLCAFSLDIRSLLTRFSVHEQITRLVCVEGWSAIAWRAGLRFDDLLRAYPPISQAKWVRVESSVNLDASGNPDPYFMSLDLATARHPQTLLATHFNGQPLTVDHGAPLRLLVPVKLGLKNVKAITRISCVAEEPRDYWAERGYSRYDGI